MKQKINWTAILTKVTVVIAAVICLSATAFAGGAESFTDDLGREVVIEGQPQRVAVLLGSFASAWILAGGDLVAAADDAWDDFDLDLSDDCVNLGSLQEINVELLIEAEPDLILASSKTQQHTDLMDSFGKMGIPVMYFDVSGFNDYLNMLNVFTQITGREDLYKKNGLDVQEQIEKVIKASDAALEEQDAPRVLSLRVSKTNVRAKGSKGTVLGEMLADLGCVNIADGSDLLDNLTLEAIVAEDPEYIFVVFQGNDAEAAEAQLEETLAGNPAWAGIQAVENGNVYYMDKHLYNFKPNQLWGLAYEQLAEILYGDMGE